MKKVCQILDSCQKQDATRGNSGTKGSYTKLAELLHISKSEYRRLMDFLRRNECLLDFLPYRKNNVKNVAV